MADENSSPVVSPPPLPDIIQRYLNGESLQLLADEYSVARQTLYRWMLTGVGDRQYESLITDALVYRIADADQTLEDSRDQCDIARARERMRFTRMDFERRRPKLYGPKQEIQTDSKITVVVQRQTPQPVVGETVDAEVVSSDMNGIKELE